jgi:hypothetical protein
MSIFPFETEKGEEGREKREGRRVKGKGALRFLPFPLRPLSLPGFNA